MAGRKRPARRAKARDSRRKNEADLIKMAELAKRSGVPTPTIKHYIREGLLPGPEVRTSRNMAYYDARLAARIQTIKDLQAERFLPLRLINQLLEPSPSARIRPDREAEQRSALRSLAPVVERAGTQRRKRAEVIKTFGFTKAELDSLESAGVLDLIGEGETAGYSGVDLALLDLLADVRRAGLGELFPASVAEPYLAAVRTLVEFEIDLFRHRVLAGGVPPDLTRVTEHAVELGGRLVVNLRAKLLPRILKMLGA